MVRSTPEDREAMSRGPRFFWRDKWRGDPLHVALTGWHAAVGNRYDRETVRRPR